MNARRKLNVGFTNGAILTGFAAGGYFQSLYVGLAVFGLFFLMAMHSGEIRPYPVSRKKTK